MKFVTTRCVLWDLLRPKSVCGRGSAPDPAGCSRPFGPRPSDLNLRPFGPQSSALWASSLAPPNPKTKLRPWEVGNLPDQSKYGCYGAGKEAHRCLPCAVEIILETVRTLPDSITLCCSRFQRSVTLEEKKNRLISSWHQVFAILAVCPRVLTTVLKVKKLLKGI